MSFKFRPPKTKEVVRFDRDTFIKRHPLATDFVPKSTPVKIITFKESIGSDDVKERVLRSKPCYHTKWAMEPRPVSWYERSTYHHRHYDRYRNRVTPGSIPTGAIPPLTWQPDIDNLITSAREELLRDFDLVSFAGELYNEGIPKLIKQWDGLSDQVLNASFGTLPFYDDVSKIAARMAGFRFQLARLESILKRGLRVVDGKEASHSFFNAPDVFGSGQVRGDTYLSYTWGARVTGSVPSGFLALQSRLGLQADLSSIWNLTPFSFLVDYIIPIGDVLSREEFVIGTSVRDAWVTRKVDGEWIYYDPTPITSTTPLPGTQQVSARVFYRQYYREPYIWDVPDRQSAAYLSEAIVPNPSSTKWLNLLALAGSVIKRRKSKRPRKKGFLEKYIL